MSIEYDNYLNEHIANVQKAMNWMFENVPVVKANCPYMSDEFYGQDHDQSKYSDKEYAAYDNYFYGGNTSYGVKTAFDYAWLHHQNHNKHHWQYWVLIKDDPDEFGQPRMYPLEMPFKYVIEMIADWWSFSWRNNNLEEIFTWYEVHGPSMLLHPKTRDLVNFILDQMHRVIIMQLRRDGKEFDEKPYDLNIGEVADYMNGKDDILGHSDLKYGLPELKKYPMPDMEHVKSAIKFFNYVDPANEKELANAILARMKEYGMSFEDFGVGDENRFKKYIPEKYKEEGS